jgi:hypothetical protein
VGIAKGSLPLNAFRSAANSPDFDQSKSGSKKSLLFYCFVVVSRTQNCYLVAALVSQQFIESTFLYHGEQLSCKLNAICASYGNPTHPVCVYA